MGDQHTAGSSVGHKICDSVLIKSIQSYLNDAEVGVKILKKDIKLATQSGDNYLSLVYQVAVTYSISDDPTPFSIKLFVKCMQDGDAMAGVVKESQVFEKEKLMYETILPAIETIAGTTFAPKCFYIQEEGSKLLVFNDLRDLGYTMCDRMKGMDFDHCKLLVEKLAVFHATSMILVKDNRKPLEQCNKGMSSDSILVDYLFKSFLTGLIETAKEWTEPEFETIQESLKKVLDNYVEVYKWALRTEEDEFRVLNHGDAWCNNFMFTYDADGSPTDVILLDHQLPFYTSPGYDLNYFIVTSPDMETRLNREEDLLEIYKTTFNRKLSELGYDGFLLTKEKLLKSYKQKSLYGFTMMLTVLPVTLRNPDGQTQDMAENMKNMLNALFTNEDFITIMKYSLRKFQKMGTFDNLPEGRINQQ